MDYNMGIQKKQDKLDNSRAMLQKPEKMTAQTASFAKGGGILL